jgi:hypothetical protein
MPCVVILGMSDSPFLQTKVLELRYEGELRLERLTCDMPGEYLGLPEGTCGGYNLWIRRWCGDCAIEGTGLLRPIGGDGCSSHIRTNILV